MSVTLAHFHSHFACSAWISLHYQLSTCSRTQQIEKASIVQQMIAFGTQLGASQDCAKIENPGRTKRASEVHSVVLSIKQTLDETLFILRLKAMR